MEHRAVSNNRHIAAWANNSGFADWHGLGGQLLSLEMVIKQLVLAKDYRIIDGDSFQQHAVSIFYGCWSHDYQPRVMGVNRFHALAVKGTTARGAPSRQTH